MTLNVKEDLALSVRRARVRPTAGDTSKHSQIVILSLFVNTHSRILCKLHLLLLLNYF
jgi:hypothetical protein